jgi:sucrose-6-phosphate hydrolase SacC (GH32 family)
MKKMTVLLAAFLTAVCFGQKKQKELPVEGIKMKVEAQYLNMPVRTGAKKEQMIIRVDGKAVREMMVEADCKQPDFWVSMDISEWKGREIVITSAAAGTGLEKWYEALYQASTPNGFQDFYKERWRPCYHFTTQRGWINDPNGMVYYKGTWHLFYQHNPYGYNWDNMTWGHAVASDLVHWHETGDAIHPDPLGTIFSGSAVVDWNNNSGLKKGEEAPLLTFYTYAGAEGFEWSKGPDFTQAIAYSTDAGKTWRKYNGNPIMKQFVPGNRDPKVIWDTGSKQWVMSLYLDGDRYGIYVSGDLKNWREIQIYSLPHDGECPDFFYMDVEGSGERKWIFTGASRHYVVGSFDGREFVPETESKVYEFGNNYYAAQTFSDAPDGRRIQTGWMSGSVFRGMPFNQQMAFPRELKLYKTGSDYTLKSYPVKELENAFDGSVTTWDSVTWTPEDHQKLIFNGRAYVLDMEMDVAESSENGMGFVFDGFEVYYSIRDKKLYMGIEHAQKREVKIEPVDGRFKLRILVDAGSVEVFANDGDVAAAFFHQPEISAQNVRILVDGNTKVSRMTIREIKNVWLRQK